MLLVLFLSVLSLCCASKESFEDKNVEFQHLVVDRESGKVFIGAVNKIYELSEDLVVKKWVATGPVHTRDSKLSDNNNTVLLVDDSRRLVICGSALGVCSTLNIYNINFGYHVPVLVLPDEDVSTVAFLAAGPASPNSSTRVLYLGTGVGSNKHIPTVSSRLLDKQNDFTLAGRETDPHDSIQFIGMRLELDYLYKRDVDIKYVYGFSSGISSYFLKTQKNKNGGYHSIIARVCQGDDNFHNSYTEIPIVCQNKDNVTYNIVQAAFVTKPGKLLAESLDIPIDDDVLLAAFSVDSVENSSIPGKTVMCAFSLANIRKKIAENIQKCFNGQASRSLTLYEPQSCYVGGFKVNNEDFCSLYANTPLDGEIPVEGTVVIELTEKITAIVATTVRVHTIVIVGTSSGHLKTIIVDNTTRAVEYEDIVVQEGSAINKDLVFSSQKDHIYAMTKNKVTKISIQKCNTYKSYAECFQDLYCGWCSVNNKCTIESDCKFEEPFLWVSADSESQTISEVTTDTVLITKET